MLESIEQRTVLRVNTIDSCPESCSWRHYSACDKITALRHHGALQVKFHAHLNSMEESLNATKREKIDVESLTRQLETGRTKATLELQASQ